MIEQTRARPMVSMIVPCYNEEEFIEACVRSIMEQDYPADRLEVLIADGRSTDRTREIVRSLAEEDARVHLVDNPDRVKSAGINRSLDEAEGDVVIWGGAHALYPADYVRANVDALEEHEADAVGGTIVTIARNPGVVGQAIAGFGRSILGFGGATFRARDPGCVREVNALFGGCFPRDLFDRIGTFDERLDRGQDREFFERIREHGGRVLFVPGIELHYYQRSSLRRIVPWTFYSGMTPFYISRITGRRLWAPRNAVPLLALAVGGVALGASLLIPGLEWLVVALAAVYVAAVALASIREGTAARSVRVFALLLFMFPVLHAAYAAGASYGLLKPVSQEKGWAGA